MGSSVVVTLWLPVFVVLLVSAIGWWAKALTATGAGAATLLGAIITVAGGWVWLIPVGVFFVSSVGFGSLPSEVDEGIETRDMFQVMANGGVALVGLLLLTYDVVSLSEGIGIYLGSLAAANADTWATEIGGRYGGFPNDLISGARLHPGESGGITVLGTLAALAGAFAVAASGVLMGMPVRTTWDLVVLIAVAGWMGAMVDSVLGSIAQKKYRCRHCGDMTEQLSHCGVRTRRMRGFLSANHVNLGCTLVGGFIGWMWAA